MKKIIFVCTGNTCRSPMAQMLMKHLLSNAHINEMEVVSRGLDVFSPSPVTHHVHTLMTERNIDCSTHRSQLLLANDITDDTLILTMTEYHKQLIDTFFPSYAHQAYTLSQYATGIHEDIVDPYGGSLEVYKQCLLQLDKLLKNLVLKFQY